MKVVKKETKEIDSRCKIIKEIDKKYTDDCNKTVANLMKDFEILAKVNEELNVKISKCEIDFGSKIDNNSNNNF